MFEYSHSDTSVFDDEIKKEIDRVTKLTSKNNG